MGYYSLLPKSIAVEFLNHICISKTDMESVPGYPMPDDFMTNTENRLSAFRFDERANELFVLDQLLLPHRIEFIPVKNTKDAFTVIRNMQVRGAPLIAVVGALGLLVEISDLEFKSPDEFVQFVDSKVQYLLESRPTAINLRNAMEQILNTAEIEGDAEFKKESVIYAILKIYHDEKDENRRLIWNGYQEASGLRVICALHQADLVEMVYALETRPYYQELRDVGGAFAGVLQEEMP
ncbi:initiation factor, subunit 2 family protein [Ancylostoma ceylanicum]|uniref:Initiation factor, subunit 2 family protein n=1 Tax=Ancylostoma ceylanicum TaxID=53326 RepID=A0A0D6M471_9BILA|nr:initiation factor, subunit 2 family protein [Ancylostoma ceylanicum]